MLGRIRHLLSDLRRWLSRHLRAVAGLVAGTIVLAAAIVWLLAGGDSSDEVAAGAPGPQVLIREAPAPAEPADLGFPAFATKNTTRVAGADPIADAAGVALAVDPASGGVPGPDAVTLVDVGQWQAAIAAASLVAAPIGAPILLTDAGELPELTENAIAALAPKGSAATAGRAAFVIGDAVAPDGLADLEVSGSEPAELAAEIDRLRDRLAGAPEHVLIASSDEPAFAMPAAGWAARSGDPVLFVERDRVPAPTARALEAYKRVPVYVLGPEDAISAKTVKRLEDLTSAGVQRVGAADPVASSVEFARYSSETFGWNINDPGHGFVIASADRPLDAAAAAPLSASGTWGPLLVSDRRDTPPPDLRGYLLDLKPGYETDPTRAVYNHLWLIGDESALSVGFQAQVDELAEVAPVSSGPGAD
ncbi:MAG: hypothetical protein GEU88_12595 [Solirubrobacterales bacterium]|nr:hypothetical protein [Solirubrobacterales bacterium]